MSMAATGVHFRTTKSFDNQLNRRAGEWNISRHVAARRLAALANSNLSLDDHARVVQLADNLSIDFVAAATALATTNDKKP